MFKNQDKSKSASWLSSKWFLGITLIVFVLISLSFIKEFLRSHQINKEISDLQKELASLEISNQELTEFVEYLKTDSYFEEQARTKLGLKAPGEHLLILQNEDQEKKDRGEQIIPGNPLNFDKDLATKNFKKWLLYFFSA